MNPPTLSVPATKFVLGCLLLLPLSTVGCGSSSGGPPTGGTAEGMAIVSGNAAYTTSTVGLASPETGLLTKDDCIQSEDISGDVVLPSSPLPSHDLVVIDRSNNAVAWLDPTTCAVKEEIAVTANDFAINAHDVVGLSATKVYVTRFAKNPTPSTVAADMNQGDDILIVDPTANTTANSAFKGRIDLSPYDQVQGSVTILASPDRALLVNGKIYVTLGDISDTSPPTVTDGRVAIIDTATDTVSGDPIDLTGLRNCSTLQYLAAAHSLFVVCSGDYNAAVQSLTSGIAQIDLSTSPPQVSKMIAASVFNNQALSADALGMITSTVGLTVTDGDYTGTPPDQLWSFDLGAGTATKIVDASSDFVFGTVLIDAAHSQAFLTDADAVTPVVRVFDISTPAAPVQKSSFAANPADGRLPRTMGFY